MATPLTATARIKIEYTNTGLRHRFVRYCAYNVVLGTNQLADRDGITTILWTLAATYVWDLMRALMSAAQVAATATATLESRTLALWNPVEIFSLAGGGTSGGGGATAGQSTHVVRDTAYKKSRWLIMEPDHNYIGHSPNGYGFGAVWDNFNQAINGGDASPNAPYRWAKSRGDRFNLATGCVAGATFDLNDKLKRARYLE